MRNGIIGGSKKHPMQSESTQASGIDDGSDELSKEVADLVAAADWLSQELTGADSMKKSQINSEAADQLVKCSNMLAMLTTLSDTQKKLKKILGDSSEHGRYSTKRDDWLGGTGYAA